MLLKRRLESYLLMTSFTRTAAMGLDDHNLETGLTGVITQLGIPIETYTTRSTAIWALLLSLMSPATVAAAIMITMSQHYSALCGFCVK